jgi:hypothetical protein
LEYFARNGVKWASQVPDQSDGAGACADFELPFDWLRAMSEVESQISN